MKTLKQIRSTYKDAETIKLIIGLHIINIITEYEGSAAIIRAFDDKRFAEYKYDTEHKILTLTY